MPEASTKQAYRFRIGKVFYTTVEEKDEETARKAAVKEAKAAGILAKPAELVLLG